MHHIDALISRMNMISIFTTYQHIRDLVVEIIARTRFTLFEAMKAYNTFTPRASLILLYAHLPNMF